MRARTVREGFFSNEALAECSPLARIVFIGLWCIADREGRFEWRIKRLKTQILPYDDVEINSLLAELQVKNFILQYEAEGNTYGIIPNFSKHQSINRHEARSLLPPPPMHMHAYSSTCMNVNPYADRPSGPPSLSYSLPSEVEVPIPSKTPRNRQVPSKPAKIHKLTEDVDVPPMFRDPVAWSALEEWISYKSERNEAYLPRGLKAFLAEWAHLTPDRFAKAVRYTIAQTWQGLREKTSDRDGGRQSLQDRNAEVLRQDMQRSREVIHANGSEQNKFIGFGGSDEPRRVTTVSDRTVSNLDIVQSRAGRRGGVDN